MSRACIFDHSTNWITDWGMLLTIPTEGYLEVSEGPYPFHQFSWIHLSTKRIRGGRFGKALEFVDIKESLVTSLNRCGRSFELRHDIWSYRDFFKDDPVMIIYLENPFFSDSKVG